MSIYVIIQQRCDLQPPKKAKLSRALNPLHQVLTLAYLAIIQTNSIAPQTEIFDTTASENGN
jgi:hypothetical protein